MKRKLYGPARVDLLPAGDALDAEELLATNPHLWVNCLRQDYLRAGARPGDGWLFAAMHAEQDEETGKIDRHWHALAAGSFVAASDRLRAQRKYAHPRAVVITREPLTRLPRPLSYMRQSWFPRRDRRLDNPPRQRMSEPAHSLMLLWWDRYPVSAFELMIGLRVIGGRLVPR